MNAIDRNIAESAVNCAQIIGYRTARRREYRGWYWFMAYVLTINAAGIIMLDAGVLQIVLGILQFALAAHFARQARWQVWPATYQRDFQRVWDEVRHELENGANR